MPRIVSSAALCAIAVLVAACASAPPSRFYTLSRTATPGAAPATFSVVVGPVAIPAVVDLPQIVVSTGPNQVTLEEYNRWASPLANNISRVVAENLVDLLGTPRVSLFQQSIGGHAVGTDRKPLQRRHDVRLYFGATPDRRPEFPRFLFQVDAH